MSALGQKQTLAPQKVMSALPRKRTFLPKRWMTLRAGFRLGVSGVDDRNYFKIYQVLPTSNPLFE
jgi:hypothetical protein